MAEWTRSDADYQTRANHLGGIGAGLNGPIQLISANVFDDVCADYLTGSAGQDLFFFDLDGDRDAIDRVTDLGSTVSPTDGEGMDS